jgi:hypothetical protein
MVKNSMEKRPDLEDLKVVLVCNFVTQLVSNSSPNLLQKNQGIYKEQTPLSAELEKNMKKDALSKGLKSRTDTSE